MIGDSYGPPDPIGRLDPIAATARLAGRRGRALLHSGRDDDGCGRWSFAACEPIRSLEARGRRIVVRGRDGRPLREWAGDPLEAVAAELAVRDRGPIGPAPLPLAIGWLGYELGQATMAHGGRLSPRAVAAGDPPDLWLGFYGAVARWAPGAGSPVIVGVDSRARAELALALAGGATAPGTPPRLGPLVADDTAGAYRDRVARILDYIGSGDVYQVNLARRLVARVRADGDPLALYAALARIAPAPYGGLIEGDGAAVLSGSPELFLRRSAGEPRLETRPIKGTRQRTGDADRDRALAAELVADAKEQAEHLMIVDLERNDLGRIAELGSVRVDHLGYVVELPQLHHLVSQVSCRVRPGVGAADVLRATFPGGSITGAPKIRAMQIIDELEPARRGPYTGALGWLGSGGSMELAIAIRCAVISGGELRLHVGGGIVADSTPERELEETEEKAAAWRASLRQIDVGEGGVAVGDRHGLGHVGAAPGGDGGERGRAR